MYSQWTKCETAEFPPYLTSSSSTNISEVDAQITIGTCTYTGHEYKGISVEDGGEVTFIQSTTPYRIHKMELSEGAKLYLPPGRYYFEELKVEDSALIETDGSIGTVTILTKKHLHIKGSAQIKPNGSSRVAILGCDTMLKRQKGGLMPENESKWSILWHRSVTARGQEQDIKGYG